MTEQNAKKLLYVLFSGLFLFTLLLMAGCAGDAERVSEGEAVEEGLRPRSPERDRWSWNRQHASVTETGALEWTPQPFQFTAGDSVRYIDYEGGDDNNDGLTSDAPWKHHPWDRNARGNAAMHGGPTTYVFKRGVSYRGTLVASESGTPDEPIRLTSDPEWGEGEAKLVGSEVVTSWRRGAGHPDIPDPELVWYADLDFHPRNVFMVDGNEIVRIDLARIPNWIVSDQDDPLSEWWTWDQPGWWNHDNYEINFRQDGRELRRYMGIDAENLTEDPDYYIGATLRTEYGPVMGTPFPTLIDGVVDVEDYIDMDAFPDREARYREKAEGEQGLVFGGMWGAYTAANRVSPGCRIWLDHRYYLEDKPHYLDTDGQFWFDRDGDGGRLYLRLPGDRDPDTVRVEAAKRLNLIEDLASARCPDRLDIIGEEGRRQLETRGMEHVEISALTFRFTNSHWNLFKMVWENQNVANAAIRLRGSGGNIHISHNIFEHTATAVMLNMVNDQCSMDSITVADNDIRYLDHKAFALPGGRTGWTGDVRVLRNRIHEVGGRVYRGGHGHVIEVQFPVTLEIAGNVLTRCYGAGIWVWGGKQGHLTFETHDLPLARYLIYNNSVVDSLLVADDWGGIETFQGGPFYIYNNISGNPGGLR